jgi:hypothetical protein
MWKPRHLTTLRASTACYKHSFIFNGLGQHSQYSDWLRAGQQRGGGSRPSRVKNFHFSTSSKPVLGPTQPPIQRVLGDLSPGLKWPGHETDHSPPTSADVTKTWIYTSNFTFYVYLNPCIPETLLWQVKMVNTVCLCPYDSRKCEVNVKSLHNILHNKKQWASPFYIPTFSQLHR